MSGRISLAALRHYVQVEHQRVTPEVTLALVDAVAAAKSVADERTGHELGGEHPLYVKLCSLDEMLDRFDFGEQP